MLVVIDTQKFCSSSRHIPSHGNPWRNITILTVQDGGRSKSKTGVSRWERMQVALVRASLINRMLQQFCCTKRDSECHCVGSQHSLCLRTALHASRLQCPVCQQRNTCHSVVTPVASIPFRIETGIMSDETMVCPRQQKPSHQMQSTIRLERHLFLQSRFIIRLNHFLHLLLLLRPFKLCNNGIHFIDKVRISQFHLSKRCRQKRKKKKDEKDNTRHRIILSNKKLKVKDTYHQDGRYPHF